MRRHTDDDPTSLLGHVHRGLQPSRPPYGPLVPSLPIDRAWVFVGRGRVGSGYGGTGGEVFVDGRGFVGVSVGYSGHVGRVSTSGVELGGGLESSDVD